MPVQSYKSVFIEKATQACLKKKEIKEKTLPTIHQKEKKKKTLSSLLGSRGRDVVGQWGSLGFLQKRPERSRSLDLRLSRSRRRSLERERRSRERERERCLLGEEEWDSLTTSESSLTTNVWLSSCPHLFLRRPYSSLRSSRDMGFRCMKLQKPPRVHSLWDNSTSRVKTCWHCIWWSSATTTRLLVTHVGRGHASTPARQNVWWFISLVFVLSLAEQTTLRPNGKSLRLIKQRSRRLLTLCKDKVYHCFYKKMW